MIKRGLSLALAAMFTIVSSGCSTLVKGNRQMITINSEPTGAKVKLSNGLKGTTPYSANLETNNDYIAEVSMDGYEQQQVQITKQFRAATTILGNILWLLIGCIVDFASGSAYGLQPDNVNVELEKKQ